MSPKMLVFWPTRLVLNTLLVVSLLMSMALPIQGHPYGLVKASAASSTAQGLNVYVMKGNDEASDNEVANALLERGHRVTLGVQTPDWDGTQADLNDYDVVVVLYTANWTRPLSSAGMVALRDYILNGGAVVTGEWFMWSVFTRQVDEIIPVLPISDYCGYNYAASTTYTALISDPTINNGLPPNLNFTFSLSNIAGTESCFVQQAGAEVFYTSSNGGGQPGAPGLVGWDVGGGRVASFSTLLTATELMNSEYRRLFVNTVEWAAEVRSDVLRITRVSPNSGGNAGTVTVIARGTGFQAGAIVRLKEQNQIILTGQDTFVVSRTKVQTSFDLRGLTSRALTFEVVNPDDTSAVAPDPFTITVGVGPRLQAQLIAPETVRRGRQSVFSLEYTNTGDADMAAPIFVISATETVRMSLATNIPFITGTVPILGNSVDQPAGILPPGTNYRIPIYFNPAQAGQVEFELSKVIADTTAIDWGAIEAEVRPDDMDPALWAAVWANFKAYIGNTWADYQLRLNEQATYLDRYGAPATLVVECLPVCANGSSFQTKYDVQELSSAALSRAAGAYPQRTLARGLDAYSPARGLPLELARMAFNTLHQRFTVGPFGRSWSHSFEYTLVQPDETHVTVKGPGGAGRTYTKNLNGYWQGSPGDFGILTQMWDGSYQLRETDGLVWSFDGNGRLTSIEEPNSNQITLRYNGTGQLAGINHTNSQSFTLEYNAQGRIIRLTDHAGQVTNYTYDASGEHLLSVTAPGGVTTSYAYVPIGGGIADDHALQTITFPDGTHQYYEYDAQGRLSAQERDGNTERVTYSYDDLGSVFVTDASNAVTTMRLGTRGQLLEAQDPLGNRVRFRYDDNFNLIGLNAPDLTTSRLSHDYLGNVVQTANPLGQAATMGYTNQPSRLDWLRDAKGKLTDFTTDTLGNLTGISYPDSSGEGFSYDAAGNLTSVTNRRGQAITFTYNALGQITRKTYPGGRTVDYAYDTRGNLTSAEDSVTGAITMQYDGRGFLTRIEYPAGRWFTFEYNNAGLRTRRTGNDGYILNYQYDTAGRLIRLADGTNAEIVRYEYDSVSRLSRETKANGTYTTYTYDDAGRLLSLVNYAPNDAVQSRFDYTYDVNGNRTSMTTLAGTTTYDYDAAGQLTGVTYPEGRHVTYQYDAAGNRVTVTEDGVSTAYTTNDMNQYTQVGNTLYAYDTDGNMTSKTDATGTTSYTYDIENRLIGVTTPISGTWQYTYDALGNRITTTHEGLTTRYLQDPVGLVDVAAEYDDGGALVARYVHGFGLVARINGTGNAAYYTFDGTGHTRQMTDATGAVANTYDYDPFGVPLQASETIPNSFKYVGRFGVMEEGNGLTFMRARYYQTTLGAFTSEDPLVMLGGTINLRSYVGSNPVNSVDPLGLKKTVTIYFWYDLMIGHAAIEVEGHILSKYPNVDSWKDVLVSSVPSKHTGIAKGADPVSFDVSDKAAQAMIQEIIRLRTERANFNLWSSNCTDDVQLVLEAAGMPHLPLFWPLQLRLAIPFYRFTGLLQVIGETISQVIQPIDPNEKVGPAGVGQQHVVGVGDDLRYTIYFENKATATAPAQEVVIIDNLDPDLDWTTFRPAEVAFGNQIFAVDERVGGFYGRVTIPDQRSGVNKIWWVDITAQINYQTGKVTWTFRTLDPLTGELPEDPLAGFLPPNDSTGRGEGHITFNIQPRSDRAAGTLLTNWATITFDTEASITTNEVTNIIGAFLHLPIILKRTP